MPQGSVCARNTGNRENQSARREKAKALIDSFIPMFEYLNEQGIDYCLVGGLAVLIRAYVSGSPDVSLRITHDADLMFGSDFGNDRFAEAYLKTFSSMFESNPGIYDQMFGGDVIKSLSKDEERLVNCSFAGPQVDGEVVGGLNLPDFDVVRKLNGYTLDDLEYDTVAINGVNVPVATPLQLLDMKRKTIALLHADLAETSRRQDFIDVKTLEQILGEEAEHGPGDDGSR